ncbi:MAG: tRNA (adenosine(37)-N6)-threonylcarbamoyltransferase complex ATPase subunit type 1 TsaE [Bacteroidales bacterium]|jgi:tRNA threonylcarbamoyladenosine biosynthesis protein TsaE|nr:tRNA (adenosine(37)-N6)-threonylcarbamoyltransferase complex ATPase subunit type 1 TsaE [Bacteroidales bacterium]MCI1784720.1 tRNA (adenosine(37)-N6)-threonylcarbamoyltransferase complex ATPase subunit type 1 TsaE [Bacteroidales bacterium]
MEHTITIINPEDLDRAAGEFIKEIGDHKIIAFYAPMGAGKTTFTTAVCRRLGVRKDAVSSPTFAIINEYKTNNGESIYHFDFYRINKISEALDIGFYDYIDSGSLCIMEWPENIEGILPGETLKVKIKVNPDESRTISWTD